MFHSYVNVYQRVTIYFGISTLYPPSLSLDCLKCLLPMISGMQHCLVRSWIRKRYDDHPQYIQYVGYRWI